MLFNCYNLLINFETCNYNQSFCYNSWKNTTPNLDTISKPPILQSYNYNVIRLGLDSLLAMSER